VLLFVVTALGCGIFGSVDWPQDNGLAQSIQSAEINLLNSFAPQPRQAAWRGSVTGHALDLSQARARASKCPHARSVWWDQVNARSRL